MTFYWPAMLWLLLLVPLLLCAYAFILGRRRRAAAGIVNLALVSQMVGKSSAWRRHLPPAILLTAIGILIVALARPAAVLSLSALRGTVILAMDVSGSMLADDIAPTRLEAAQAAAKAFISNQPPNVQIGIVAFAGTAHLVQAPSIDREALYAAIDRFELQRGTAVGSGVLASLATVFPDEDFGIDIWSGTGAQMGQSSAPLDQPNRREGTSTGGSELNPAEVKATEDATVILLTDGATTTGPDPREAAQKAADHGVRIFTVGFGSEEGAVIRIEGRSMRAAPDFDALRDVADATGGRFFEAQSLEDLNAVYASVSNHLVTETALTDISFIFAAAGAVVALLSATLSVLWFGRIA